MAYDGPFETVIDGGTPDAGDASEDVEAGLGNVLGDAAYGILPDAF